MIEDIEDEATGAAGATDEEDEEEPEPVPLTAVPVSLFCPTFSSASSEKCPPTTGRALKKIGPGETG